MTDLTARIAALPLAQQRLVALMVEGLEDGRGARGETGGSAPMIEPTVFRAFSGAPMDSMQRAYAGRVTEHTTTKDGVCTTVVTEPDGKGGARSTVTTRLTAGALDNVMIPLGPKVMTFHAPVQVVPIEAGGHCMPFDPPIARDPDATGQGLSASVAVTFHEVALSHAHSVSLRGLFPPKALVFILAPSTPPADTPPLADPLPSR